MDISDAFIGMGVAGGVLFVLTIGFTLAAMFTYMRRAPLSLSLPLLGMLTALLGGWIGLGQYALAPFTWFCIGHLVRELRGPAAQQLTTGFQVRAVQVGLSEPRPRAFT